MDLCEDHSMNDCTCTNLSIYNYLIETIDERLNGRGEVGYRPVRLFLGLGRAVGGARIAVAATRRRGWPGR